MLAFDLQVCVLFMMKLFLVSMTSLQTTFQRRTLVTENDQGMIHGSNSFTRSEKRHSRTNIKPGNLNFSYSSTAKNQHCADEAIINFNRCFASTNPKFLDGYNVTTSNYDVGSLTANQKTIFYISAFLPYQTQVS